MRIYNDSENMVYDEDDPRCIVRTCYGQGGTFAFVQCLDLGFKSNRLSVPGIKRYWGRWNSDDPEGSVRSIMANGGKWPELPSIDRFKEFENLPYND